MGTVAFSRTQGQNINFLVRVIKMIVLDEENVLKLLGTLLNNFGDQGNMG